MNWLRWPKVTSSQPTMDVPSSHTYCWREPVKLGCQRFRPGYRAPHSSSVIASAARTGAGTAAMYSWNRVCSSALRRGRASNRSVRSILNPGDNTYRSLDVKRSNAARRATSWPRPRLGASRNTRRAACEPAQAATCSMRSAATLSASGSACRCDTSQTRPPARGRATARPTTRPACSATQLRCPPGRWASEPETRFRYGSWPLSGSTRGQLWAVISVSPARRWNAASATTSIGRSVRTSIFGAGRLSLSHGSQLGGVATQAGRAVSGAQQALQNATDPNHPPTGLTYDTEFSSLQTWHVGDGLPGGTDYVLTLQSIRRRDGADSPDTSLYAVVHAQLRQPRETRLLGQVIRSDTDPHDYAVYKGEMFRIGRVVYRVNWISQDENGLAAGAVRRPDAVTALLKLDYP